MPQPLSSKEASLFRQVVKNYESKQFKKGLKAAEQILRKTPNHGDTQAMKALLLNSLGQGDEAFALAKVALKNDMKSHVCWHVYGLLWRSVKNYEEAIKAYKFALKLEPESAQILRDLALLQVQMRDFQGYIESRKQMLQARPSLRQNWTAMAVAHHLAGDLAQAEKVLNIYEDTLKNPPSKTDMEHSEAQLYKNAIIAELGEVQRALDHLETIAKTNLDKTAVMEMRAQYLLQLERMEDAEKAYRDLIDRNPEYRAYYEGLQKSLRLAPTDVHGLGGMYKNYAEQNETVDLARRVPLDFLEGEEFRAAAEHYLQRMLQKGVLSTFNNVKALYTNPAKRQTIQTLVEGYASEKLTNGTAAQETTPAMNTSTYDANAMPSATTGTEAMQTSKNNRFHEAVLFFLAQHYNYRITRNLKLAMQYTEKLIEMSPKTYDYRMTKARILKHQGNVAEAAKVMNEARELDLKDRYINTKCAKYQLRNNDNDSALNTMSKFTRNETVGGTLGDLLEMQVHWFLIEDGEAYLRQGKLGMALKRFHSVWDIFNTWEEDQFDFHSFSLRKGQIRAYIEMIRWEDRLRENPYYIKGAVNAIAIYISLFDNPALSKGELVNGYDHLSEPERKKAIKKAKKEQEKQEKEDAERREADRKAAAKKGNTTVDGEVKKVDQDPRGSKLLETKEPLEVAMKFLNPLLESGQNSLDAQHAGFEVFVRRKKFFLALKCLLRALTLATPSEQPNLHNQLLHFRQILASLSSEEKDHALLLQLSKEKLPLPYGDLSKAGTDINEQYLAQNPSTPACIFAAARARIELQPEVKSQDSVERILLILESTRAVDEAHGEDQITLENAREGIQVLKEHQADMSTLEKYVKRARVLWPEATILNREAGMA